MLSFIHSDGVYDLTHLNVTFTEQNQIFADSFSNEISFPFQVDLTDKFFIKSGFNIHYNAKTNKTVYIGKLNRDGEIIDASLTIARSRGIFGEAVIKAGINDFPNFSKKLSELPLQFLYVDDIDVHAATVIDKDYPATNYNFPMVFTDKYKTDNFFPGFLGIINNYADGAFLINGFDTDSTDIIRNIVQPMPYLMHVVNTAIQNAGYTLAGDILTDVDLLKALLFVDADYYFKAILDSMSVVIKPGEFDGVGYNFNTKDHYVYTRDVTITKKGIYNILGSFTCLAWTQTSGLGPILTTNVQIGIQLNRAGVTTDIFVNELLGNPGYSPVDITPLDQPVDATQTFEVGDVIHFFLIQIKPDIFDETITIGDFQIIPERYLYDDGSMINNIINLKTVDLTKTVPDITVSDLITFIKNAKNYDFNVIGNQVIMNKITPQIDRSTAIDISEYEIPDPVRTYNEEKTFEMKFVDGKAVKEYPYDSVYLDSTGVKTNVYTTTENTKIIAVDGLPLPVILRDDITTAYALDNEKSKIRIVFFKAIASGGKPVCFNNPAFLIPSLFSTNFHDWLRFRIFSGGWEWSFIVSSEKFRDVKIQSLVYAYGNYHLFTERDREFIDDLWIKVTAKSENLT